MEKDVSFSIMVIKWIWLRGRHPSSEVLGMLAEPGKLRLSHGLLVEEANLLGDS